MNRVFEQTRGGLLALGLLLVVLVSSPAAFAATLTVGPSGTYATIGGALAAASSGDIIEIETGTYAESLTMYNAALTTLTLNGNGSTVAPASGHGLDLRGGGGHVFNDLTFQNAAGYRAANLNTGDPGGSAYSKPMEFNNCVFDSSTDASQYTVILVSGSTDPVTFRGCTMTGSTAAVLYPVAPVVLYDTEIYGSNAGAGVQYGSSVTMYNCIVRNFTYGFNNPGFVNLTLTFDNTEVYSNTHHIGGAGANMNLIIRNYSVFRNSVSHGIWLSSSGWETVDIDDSLFYANGGTATYAILLQAEMVVTIDNCVFNQLANQTGLAIFNDSNLPTSLTVNKTLFTGHYGDGAGFFYRALAHPSEAEFNDCGFYAEAGAWHFRTGHVRAGSSLNMNRCYFYNGAGGGAILDNNFANWSANFNFTDCVFEGTGSNDVMYQIGPGDHNGTAWNFQNCTFHNMNRAYLNNTALTNPPTISWDECLFTDWATACFEDNAGSVVEAGANNVFVDSNLSTQYVTSSGTFGPLTADVTSTLVYPDPGGPYYSQHKADDYLHLNSNGPAVNVNSTGLNAGALPVGGAGIEASRPARLVVNQNSGPYFRVDRATAAAQAGDTIAITDSPSHRYYGEYVVLTASDLTFEGGGNSIQPRTTAQPAFHQTGGGGTMTFNDLSVLNNQHQVLYLTLSSDVVLNNCSLIQYAQAIYTLAIQMGTGANLTLTDCYLEGHIEAPGGAAMGTVSATNTTWDCENVVATTSNFPLRLGATTAAHTITSCTFLNAYHAINDAAASGSGASLTVTGSTFDNFGHSAYSGSMQNVSFTNSSISNCGLAGINDWVYGTMTLDGTTIDNCNIGVNHNRGNLIVQNGSVIRNCNDGASGSGGISMSLGGGALTVDIIVDNSMFEDNFSNIVASAASGGQTDLIIRNGSVMQRSQSSNVLAWQNTDVLVSESTITNSGPSNNQFGLALNNFGASATVTSSTLSHSGFGMHNQWNASLTVNLTAVTFSNNATADAWIHNEASVHNVTIDNCSFSGGSYGLWLRSNGGSLDIDNSSFTGSTYHINPSAWLNGTATIDNCTFSGGAHGFYPQNSQAGSTFDITGCTFLNGQTALAIADATAANGTFNFSRCTMYGQLYPLYCTGGVGTGATVDVNRCILAEWSTAGLNNVDGIVSVTEDFNVFADPDVATQARTNVAVGANSIDTTVSYAASDNASVFSDVTPGATYLYLNNYDSPVDPLLSPAVNIAGWGNDAGSKPRGTLMAPITLDVTAVTPDSTAPVNSADTVNFTVDFDEFVVASSFADAADLDITYTPTAAGGSAVITQGANTAEYNVAVSGVTGDGDYTVAADTGSDIVAFFGGSALNSSAVSSAITVDNTKQTPAISSTESSPTNNTPIPVEIDFGQEMTGFAVGDIVVAGGTKGSFQNLGSGLFSVNITPSSNPVTITVDVNADVAEDLAGNLNNAASTFSIDYSSVNPGVTLATTAPTDPDPTNLSPVAVTVTFTAPVTGFDPISEPGDVTLGNCTLGNFSGSGANYSFELTPSGQGAFTAQVPAAAAQDAATNANTVSNPLELIYDSVEPTPVLASTVSNPTTLTLIPVSIDFGEEVSDFVVGDITVGNGTKGNFQDLGGGAFSVDITPTDSYTTVTVDIAGGVAQDLATNDNLAATQLSVLHDTAGPLVLAANPAKGATVAALTAVEVTFDEAVLNLVAADLSVNGSQATTVTGTGVGPYTFIGFAEPLAGPIAVVLDAGTMEDELGNAFTGDSWSYLKPLDTVGQIYEDFTDDPAWSLIAAGSGSFGWSENTRLADGLSTGEFACNYARTTGVGEFYNGDIAEIDVTQEILLSTGTFTVSAMGGDVHWGWFQESWSGGGAGFPTGVYMSWTNGTEYRMSANVFAPDGSSAGVQATATGQIFEYDTTYEYTMIMDPSVNGGNGAMTLVLTGGPQPLSARVDFPAGLLDTLGTVDSFGFATRDGGGTAGVIFYMDDVHYTGAPVVEPTAAGNWELYR